MKTESLVIGGLVLSAYFLTLGGLFIAAFSPHTTAGTCVLAAAIVPCLVIIWLRRETLKDELGGLIG